MVVGDNWGSAPDGLKSHDLQFWLPLQWDDTQLPPLPRPLVFLDTFAINVTSTDGFVLH